MKKILYTFLAAAVVFASCAKEALVPQDGVTLDKDAIELYPGQEYDLSATITPANATSNLVKWSSSDTKIAVVTGHGQVIAVAPSAIDSKQGMGDGTATITATTSDGEIAATCKVTVHPYYVKGLELKKAAADTLAEYDTLQLFTTISPANASYQDLNWESSDNSIAKVSASGLVTAYKEGTVTITVTAKDKKNGTFTQSVGLRITKSNNIVLWTTDEKGEVSLAAGTVKEAITSGFLTYKDGKVSWDKNATGMPRQATIRIYDDKDTTVLKGAAIITQISNDDFLKTWKINAKLFDDHKTMGFGSTQNTYSGEVEVVKCEGENGNNVLICGLYKSAEVQGKVEVNLDDKNAKFGIYVSSKRIYGAGRGTYCVLLPECAAARSWGNLNLFPTADKAFSDTNYDWVWFTYDIESNSLMYNFIPNGQKSANDKWYYCGLSFGTASETAITGTEYDVIYQANYNSDIAMGMFLSR